MLPIFERGSHVVDSLFLSPVHIGALLIFIILVCTLYFFRHLAIMKSLGRYGLISVLVISELSIILWTFSVGLWDIRFTLPLQLCTISLYICTFMLIRKSYRLFEIVYFFGLAGAFQALITPDLFYTFPHFRFIHFFLAHFAIILSILYMVWVEQFVVTFRSMLKSFLVLNVIAAIAFLANLMTGANYMFLARKPENPSILDVLGPFPLYILSLQVIAFIMFLMLYLPFLILRRN
ncbi:hypothetical protein JCM9140_1102 [Halalkalibacter wakoensis JCM 9140]|uniref:Uncharacterized protein n=1 Tax=Halalkalibacter wakoensis JCM 9140 TaxID=1236970 RepID=W4Q170_9BACI|nr:TIGR02206 family membrane protein [Halalkalibacter wakoensis]GAE25129.1 hypothetical protein JCM9140_1102 [Halalkalibacter wakoensis JCM 9140]